MLSEPPEAECGKPEAAQGAAPGHSSGHLRGRSGGADSHLAAIRLLGAGDILEPMYLILKWERAARSSLHTAFPS